MTQSQYAALWSSLRHLEAKRLPSVMPHRDGQRLPTASRGPVLCDYWHSKRMIMMMVVWVGRGLTHHESSSTAAAACLAGGWREPSSRVTREQDFTFPFFSSKIRNGPCTVDRL
jgi:hypothetical protein